MYFGRSYFITQGSSGVSKKMFGEIQQRIGN